MVTLFEGAAKGELLQLRDQLDGNEASERKTAAKRVIALMRSGENVSSLFSSMLRSVKTTDIELKKLTYLYLQSYSSQEPEQAIMAVNAFVTDSQDSNPLIRALAVRTMCRIRLQSVAEYMVLPLKKTLVDKDPYVRKTAAFGVSKLFDMIPDTVEASGLLDDLVKLLFDDNPMVVANTTASIFEINERRSTPICQFTKETVGVILAAIASCSDWCQTILYNGLAHYVPVDSADADILIERFTPFLKHNNPAVVIGSFRCIFSWIAHSSKDTGTLFPQIIPPFLTLVTSASPEVQYVVLRALSLFCQKYPRALAKEIKTFFCKYNDPSYVKLEKLDVIVTICGPQNAQLVLDELAEYANGVDVGFVRKAIKSIGQIAVKIEAASRRAVDILVQLVTGKASYAVEESVIVVADILRKYPGSFESILQTVCQNFETLKEPRAKAAGIWMLGEYCDLIEHADVLLDPFLDTFHDEQPQVQLQILASLVKLYIDKPDETRDQLQFVLNEATKDTNVPDVKNRALIYWRILSADAQVAKDIVLFGKQTVMHSGDNFEDAILDELISNMGTVAGVLHVVPADFVSRVRFSADDEDDEVLNEGVLRSWRQIALNDDSFLELFIDYDQANLHFRIVNKSPTAIGQFAIAINKNPIGLAIAEQPTFPSSLEFGDVAEVKVPFLFQPGAVGNLEVSDLQIALKTSAGLVFGTARIPVEFATVDGGKISNDRFRELSGSLPVAITVQVDDVKLADESQLTARKIFVVGKAEDKLYVAFQIASGAPFIAEIAQKGRDIVASVKGPDRTTLTLVQQGAQALFGAK